MFEFDLVILLSALLVTCSIFVKSSFDGPINLPFILIFVLLINFVDVLVGYNSLMIILLGLNNFSFCCWTDEVLVGEVADDDDDDKFCLLFILEGSVTVVKAVVEGNGGILFE